MTVFAHPEGARFRSSESPQSGVVPNRRHFRTLAILRLSRELSLTAPSRGRWREMRSEKEQMTAGKETNTVELQLRDIPGEQEHTPGSAKQKEEKKEVFSKVRGPG